MFIGAGEKGKGKGRRTGTPVPFPETRPGQAASQTNKRPQPFDFRAEAVSIPFSHFIRRFDKSGPYGPPAVPAAFSSLKEMLPAFPLRPGSRKKVIRPFEKIILPLGSNHSKGNSRRLGDKRIQGAQVGFGDIGQ